VTTAEEDYVDSIYDAFDKQLVEAGKLSDDPSCFHDISKQEVHPNVRLIREYGLTNPQ
jgi:hypothetical protein